jgi:hypothetical protein
VGEFLRRRAVSGQSRLACPGTGPAPAFTGAPAEFRPPSSTRSHLLQPRRSSPVHYLEYEYESLKAVERRQELDRPGSYVWKEIVVRP